MADTIGAIGLVLGTIVVVVWVRAIIDVFTRPADQFNRQGTSALVWRLLVLVTFGVGAAVYLLTLRRKMEEELYGTRHERTVVDRAVLAATAGEPGVAKPDPILVVDGLKRRFGGLVAVDVEHLEIQRGLITGLIGPNGAGKTTLFNLLTGFDEPDEGSWAFDGRDMKGSVAHEMANLGMVRTFQLTKALSKMTVLDNMMLGATQQTGEHFASAFVPARWSDQEEAARERAMELLGRFGIEHMAEQYAGTLSGGQRKLLEMARALMTDPELVMLDEPMAGVNPALTQSLLSHVKDLRDEGMTVIFVEHDMDVVRDISDWVVVMAEGEIIAEGTHDDITGNPEVIDAYLGTRHGESAAEGPVTHAHAEAASVVEAREELVDALEDLSDD